MIWETWVWFLKCVPLLYHLMNLRALRHCIEFRHRGSLKSYTGRARFFFNLFTVTLQCNFKIYTTFQIYTIIFGLRFVLVCGRTCRVGRLTESDVTVMPLVVCLEWLCWLWYCTADVVPLLIALPFVTKTSEKYKCASPGAMQVKNWWKKSLLKRS